MKKKEQGITLIALVITIIVMLILVIVTINIAMNGDLFGKAKDAVTKTQEEIDREQLISSVAGAYDPVTGIVNESSLRNGLSGWTITKNGDGTYTCVSSDNNSFSIDSNGNVTKQDFWVDIGNGKYQKGDEIVELWVTTYTNKQVQEKLGITGSDEDYQGTWTVVGVNGSKLKLISTENVSEEAVPIGLNDPYAIEAVPLEEGGTLTDEIKARRAYWSYKNAPNTLDAEVQRLTGIDSARSIRLEDIYEILGEESITKGGSYGTEYIAQYYYVSSKTAVYSKTGTRSNGNITWGTAKSTGFPQYYLLDENDNFYLVNRNNPSTKELIVTQTGFSYNLTQSQKEQMRFLYTGNTTDGFWIADTARLTYSGRVYSFDQNQAQISSPEIFGGPTYNRSTRIYYLA